MIIKMIAIPGGKMGTVGKVSASVGDKVLAGDVLAQVETGKGNRPIKTTCDGTVSKVLCTEGGQVASGAELF
ncbi:MAG: acetyl-CoA carboxylase biotin carboxyl carrier protein subunit, partial [Oscillospiraceae bacterium]